MHKREQCERETYATLNFNCMRNKTSSYSAVSIAPHSQYMDQWFEPQHVKPYEAKSVF